MKRILLAFSSLHFGLCDFVAQDCITPPNWVIVKDTMPGFSKQHDLFFASENVGYTTGVRGTMRKSTDGGRTWDILHGLEGMGTRAIMRSLYFVDEQIGFAAGDGDYNPFQNIDQDAEFLRTIDGGLSWEKSIIEGVERVNDLKFFDALHGLAVLSAKDGSKTIGETFDGGKTWTFLETKMRSPIYSKFILAGDRVLLYGIDSMHSGNYILFEIKEDGSIDYALTAPLTKSNFYFYNDDIGYASAGDIAYKTTDGGITWEDTYFPTTNLYSIVHFADEDHGLVVNTLYETDTSAGEAWSYPVGLEIYVTNNGGDIWEWYESGAKCAIEGRLTHYANNGSLHFLGGRYYGSILFDSLHTSGSTGEEITFHPNPVFDYMQLENVKNGNFQAEIYNLTGQKVYEIKAATRIALGHVSPGYYILMLLAPGERLVFPFIKL